MDSMDPKPGSAILSGDSLKIIRNISRREFVSYSLGTAAALYLSTFESGCGGGEPASYPIGSTVVTTVDRVLCFPMPPKIDQPNSGVGLCPTELPLVSQYAAYGYGSYTYGPGLEAAKRYDIMANDYSNPSPVRLSRMANFFTMSDIHITDKEAPNQLIYIQQEDPIYGASGTSLYSPIMPYTTHVLDAAIQTMNALHELSPFDFGISLGDACNSTQYNELRWYIDVIDGKVIQPSSGAHAGAATIDYQKPYRAAGLNPAISWYQVLGNHDHFMIGSIPVDANPDLHLRESYTSGNVWKIGDVLKPNAGFPCCYDTFAAIQQQTMYTGYIDGATPTGTIKGAGMAATIPAAPTIVADPSRRSLLRTEWMQEFFNSTTAPRGHGLNLVDPSMGAGFACYSFVPKSDVPLKVIVLDDTQSETDGSHDIHGHGFLDATRWGWLQAELASGQAANQLMIIAAHVPLAVANIGTEVEWWESNNDPNAVQQNAVSLANLVAELQNTPNLLMWIAGHRHFNTVKALKPPPGGSPVNGFWQVETSSLRDHPQQFRTFEIYLNSDYSVSIIAVNVDPAVGNGTPAAKSRAYSIAAQQIVQNDIMPNAQNLESQYNQLVESMDPTRAQDGSYDLSIKYASIQGVPYCASYNAELFKQLTPAMISVLKAKYSPSAQR
ncbi:MAG: TIGR03768 family metallophosphoesterase [Terracidiphilus sp.]